MKRKLLPLLLALALLAGCVAPQTGDTPSPTGGESPQTPGPSPAADLPQVSDPPGGETALAIEDLLQAMLDAVPEGPDSYLVLDEQTALSYLELSWGIPPADVARAAMAMSGGMGAFEIAVFQMTDGADAEAAAQKAQEHLTDRQGDFTGYAPDQAELASNGLIFSNESWVALAISEDPRAALDALARSLSSGTISTAPSYPAEPDPVETGPVETDPVESDPVETDPVETDPVESDPVETDPVETDPVESDPVETPPMEPDPAAGRRPFVDPDEYDMTIYDTSAILAAWESGDRSALSQADGETLAAAEAVLEKSLSEGMSGYEKERALYLWLISRVKYDFDIHDPLATVDPASFQPYGPLVTGKGVCLGFASTFQLLMDMAGVECITVVGAAFRSQSDHAWNMVRLDGAWYCVDATWDLGAPSWALQYFNVTSGYMAGTDHQWDYHAVPEATATDGGRP